VTVYQNIAIFIASELNGMLKRDIFIGKVKISLLQAMETHRVDRG
jgi:hypothetical protein